MLSKFKTPFDLVANDLKTELVSDSVFPELARNAQLEDAGKLSIKTSMDSLRDAGGLLASCSDDPSIAAHFLMRVGAVNLSVGRLLEGHINALSITYLYGTVELKATVEKHIENGAILGVWGADSASPVVSTHDGNLAGSKNFASGLGTVTHAVVTVNSGPDVRLALVDVTDPARADASSWIMEGMKATASGTFDFQDIPLGSLEWIGEPGDYLKEPDFVGGVWRIAALQVGASIGLLDCAAARLREIGRMDAEAQKTRLMTVLAKAWAGAALVERAAAVSAEKRCQPEQIVATSIAARLFTEEVGLEAVMAVQQGLGLQHFAADSQTGRLARDLSVYLRQAARDAFLQRAAVYALGQDNGIWGPFQ